MHSGDGGTRMVGLAFDRVIGDSHEGMAWPAISFTEQRYLSALNKVEVPRFSQSLWVGFPAACGEGSGLYRS